MADPYQKCLITIDGTDFLIQEPSPFDPQYYSHKFKHAGVRYEIGICIKTGWIVWVMGPFPCGGWSDLRISRHALHYELLTGEIYCADGTYNTVDGWSVTPDGTHSFAQRQYSHARARHETVNGCFKRFRCLRNMWRHDRQKHAPMCHAVTKIVQLGIRAGNLTWMLDYDEAEFD